jgi:glucuronate isomerase
MARWPIFDPHSHIDPHRPAARGLSEILGYHYYTELAHSAGMPAELVGHGVPDDTRVHHLAEYLDRLDNTVQYSWLMDIARTFHEFSGERIAPETVSALIAKADHARDGAAWDQRVWAESNLEAVFLTNDFDDPLTGWDTSKYVPCLRVDDLVLKLHEARTVDRLKTATNVDVGDLASLRIAIGSLVKYFVEHGARACAVSLPPDFIPRKATEKRAVTPIRRALHGLEVREDECEEIRTTVFWMIAELCADHGLPFDLMIGPIRDSYPSGVAGGRDLFDRRVSLADYGQLFSHFSHVTFPVSTLSPDASAELVAYAWIFPNVVPMGHWWYSNVPTFIEHDLTARLQAVPKTKLVGYYSDAYKLEFILPKFTMYRRLLAKVLADRVEDRGCTEEEAVNLARGLLLDNPRRLFSRGRSARLVRAGT